MTDDQRKDLIRVLGGIPVEPEREKALAGASARAV